jgi:hypothetical protein
MTPSAEPLTLGQQYGAHIVTSTRASGDNNVYCANCGHQSVKSRKYLLDAERAGATHCVHCSPRNTSRKHEQQPRRAGKFVSRLETTE